MTFEKSGRIHCGFHWSFCYDIVMNSAEQTFLFDLLSTPSPTGFEAPGQKKWMKYVKQYADKVQNDAYGTAWATIEGKGKKGKTNTIMLEAHADEIGYIVKDITKEGYLRIDRIGGSDTATARGRRLSIMGDKGEVRGIIGNTAIHIRDRDDEKVPKVHELYVDVGASSDKDVEKMGIRVGHPAVYTDQPEIVGKDRIVGRAVDNRLGSFIIAQVMKNLSKSKPECTVYAVNAVQEEVGGYGAKMVTYRLKPDVAIVFDVTHSTDSPGVDKNKHGSVQMCKGPTVTHGKCNHPLVVERLMKVAKVKKIPLQHESSSYYSGTDTDQIFHVEQGIPSALVSVPLRYMHSVVEMVQTDDVQKAIDLLTEFVKSVKTDDDFHLKL